MDAFAQNAGSGVLFIVAGPEALDQVRARRAARPSPPVIPDDLPTASFLNLRAAYARSYAPATVAAIDRIWMRAFTDARGWPRRFIPDGDSQQASHALALPVSVRLAARAYTAATDSEAMVVLRAVQAGLLRQGVLLHHNHGAGLGHRISPSAAASINRTLSTQDAAAATLHLLFPYAARPAEPYWHPADLRAQDVADDGSTVKIGGVDLPVPAHARPALAAHQVLLQRRGPRTHPELYFDTADPRDLRRQADRALTATATSPQLPDQPPERRSQRGGRGTLWMRQRGLALRNLVGPTRDLDLATPIWT
ncbi:hypothetical protein [Spirillospora sp. CA-128828]|uniref:hypothetical protein n=1 Tax=Spirillospora sp. CA-128828 TaxID=3240033 RepID=UPI003D90F892